MCLSGNSAVTFGEFSEHSVGRKNLDSLVVLFVGQGLLVAISLHLFKSSITFHCYTLITYSLQGLGICNYFICLNQTYSKLKSISSSVLYPLLPSTLCHYCTILFHACCKHTYIKLVCMFTWFIKTHVYALIYYIWIYVCMYTYWNIYNSCRSQSKKSPSQITGLSKPFGKGSFCLADVHFMAFCYHYSPSLPLTIESYTSPADNWIVLLIRSPSVLESPLSSPSFMRGTYTP